MSVILPGRRELTRRRKVDAICAEALELIEQEGLEGLTIASLARRMSWAMGALYRYFPSKDALFMELQSRVVQAYCRALEAELDGIAETALPLQRVVFCAMHYWRWFRQRRSHASLIAMSLAHPQQLIDDQDGEHIFRTAFASLQRISDCFAAAEATGALTTGSSAERTVILWSNLLGLMQVEKLARFAPSVIEVSRLLELSLATLLTGWGASKDALETALVHESWSLWGRT
jgi:AcrR family transcriptional regulator